MILLGLLKVAEPSTEIEIEKLYKKNYKRKLKLLKERYAKERLDEKG